MEPTPGGHRRNCPDRAKDELPNIARQKRSSHFHYGVARTHFGPLESTKWRLAYDEALDLARNMGEHLRILRFVWYALHDHLDLRCFRNIPKVDVAPIPFTILQTD